MGLGNKIARCGGLRSFLSMWIRSSFKPFWDLLQAIPGVRTILNQVYLGRLLDSFISTVPRIPKYSLKQDMTTMDVMYDESRTTYSRLLPRQPEYTSGLPDLDAASGLFLRDGFVPESNRNVTLLIGFYAQWFTHQFFNTNPDDPRMTNQPVGINLSQLYGSTPKLEKELRAFEGGLLKSSIRNGQEFPEIIPAPEGSKFYGKDSEIFRMPIDLANKVPGFAAIQVIFFRRHNYVARELAKDAAKRGVSPLPTDEELFQKAKIIVCFNVLRITMNDYVARALQSSYVKIRFDQAIKNSLMYKVAGPSYYPPINAIQVEFNFLYRWHQFYPDVVKTVKELPLDEPERLKNYEVDISKHETTELKFPPKGEWLSTDWNSVAALTETDDGLERVLFSAAGTRAGKLELRNSNEWLVENVIKAGMKKCREYELASYNDYREHFGFGRLSSFEQISTDPRILSSLKSVYKDVDQIEYYTGIFAEDKDFGGIHGPFLATIGVGMTYCGIFASRLFETDSVNEKLLTKRGMELANELNYFQDLTKRHTRLGDTRMRFTMPEDAPLSAGQ